jgi:hypothetical protein
LIVRLGRQLLEINFLEGHQYQQVLEIGSWSPPTLFRPVG